MIKTLLVTLILLSTSLCVLSQNNGNYILIINGDSIHIDLDSEQLYKTDSGEELTIKVVQPTILTYSDDMIAFKHHKSLSVSNTQIEEGIEQCAILKATGSGFMVQKYTIFDPSSFTRFMLKEITKESVSYGYKKKERKFEKKLSSGQTIKGIQAVLTYKGEKEIYTVATYGEKDEGIIVVTMLLNPDLKEDKAFIDLFLKTLEIKE